MKRKEMVSSPSAHLKHLPLLLAVGIVLLIIPTGRAEVLVYESFATDAAGSGDNYTEGILLGSYTGYTGPDKPRTGLAGTYYQMEAAIATSVNASAELNSLSYAGFNPGVSGHGEAFRDTGFAGTQKYIGRDTDYTLPGGFSGCYIAALVDFNGAQAGGFYFGDPGTGRYNGVYTDGTNLIFDANGNSSDDYSVAVGSGTHLVVIQFVDGVTAGNPNTQYYDQWKIWVDPTISGGELPASPDATGFGIGLKYTGAGNIPIPAIGLDSSNLDAGESVLIDELYIATDASDFLVPEPATLGLLVVGLPVLLKRRRG